MLKLFNPSGQRIGALEHYENLVVEEEVSQLNLLSFDVPKEYSSLIEFEGYVETEHDGRYIIKEKSSRADTMGYKAIYDLEDLNGHIESKAYVSMPLSAMMSDLLAGTGWVINTSDTSLRTATAVTIDRLDLIYAIVRDTFGLEIKFDNQAKVITAEQYLGSDKGVYFHDEVNLLELQVDGDTYDFATRIIPRGANGLSIESVNGGLPYLENTQHSSKIITRYWSDERYTIPENLKAAAQLKLDAMSKPLKSYAARVVDLARIAGISILEYSPGDVITLVDRESGIKEKQRIIVRRKYLDEPERDTITIANRLRQMDDSIKTEFDGVRQDFSVIRATLQALDEKILLRVAQNVYDADKAAMDLAYAQLQVDIGGVSADVLDLEGNVADLELTASNFQVALGNVENDVANVKLQITPEAITETVESNSEVLAKKADVQLVSDAWQASFAAISIGATNLVLDSERERTSADYNVGVWYMSEDWIPGEEYTISFRGVVTPGTFKMYRDGGTVLAADPVYDAVKDLWVATFVCPDPAPGQPNTGAFTIFNTNIDPDGEATVSHVKLEKGNIRTDYSQSPLELYTGIVSIDATGVKVSRSDSEINSHLQNDGLQVKDGEKVLSAFGDAGAVIPELQVEELHAPKVMQFAEPGVFTVGFDAESTFGSLQQAFNELFKNGRRFLRDQILLEVYGEHNGDVVINDIYGGTVIVRLMDSAKVYGKIIGRNIYSDLTVESGGSGRGFIHGGDGYPIQLSRCFNTVIENLNFNGVTVGVLASASNAVLRGCDFGTDRFYYGYIADRGANIIAVNNRGKVTGNRAETRNAIIYQQGEVPQSALGDSVLGGAIYNTSVVPAPSSYSPPAVTTKEFKRLFTVATFDTISLASGKVNSAFGPAAVQNRYSSAYTMNEGRIRLGREIYDFIQGGSGVSIRMRLKRMDSSHGSSGAVLPTPKSGNHSASYPSGAVRGGWTGWATGINPALFTAAGADLRYYNGVTGASAYAIWDGIEIEVTVTKNI